MSRIMRGHLEHAKWLATPGRRMSGRSARRGRASPDIRSHVIAAASGVCEHPGVQQLRAGGRRPSAGAAIAQERETGDGLGAG